MPIVEERMTNNFHEIIIPLVLLKFYDKARRQRSVSVCVCVPVTNRSTGMHVYPVHLIWKLLVGLDWGSGGQEGEQCNRFASYPGKRRVSRDAGYSRMNLPFQGFISDYPSVKSKIFFPAVQIYYL